MSATSELLSNYQNIIGNLTLVTGAKGVFDVTANGTMLYSKDQTGRHAEPNEVLELFTAHVGPGVERYSNR